MFLASSDRMMTEQLRLSGDCLIATNGRTNVKDNTVRGWLGALGLKTHQIPSRY